MDCLFGILGLRYTAVVNAFLLLLFSLLFLFTDGRLLKSDGSPGIFKLHELVKSVQSAWSVLLRGGSIIA